MSNQQWRLPTIEELSSLLWGKLPEGEKSGRVYDSPAAKAAFHGVFGEYPCVCFWSSSTHDYYDEGAWGVRFDEGFIDYNYNGSYNQVQLVRGAIGGREEGSETSERYTISKCGNFVTDNKTGLEWKKQPEEGRYTWNEAMKMFKQEDTTTRKMFKQEDTTTRKIHLRLEIRDGKKVVVDQDGRELHGVVSIDARSSVDDLDQLTVCFFEGDSSGNYFNCRSVEANVVE